MADSKLSALTALGAAPATNDLLYLDDVSAGQSKSMTVLNLFTSPALVTPDIGAATGTSLQLSGLTASLILATDASKNLVSLSTTTYPSLTELSYLKGVTSAIQTQLNAKGAGTVTSVSGTSNRISVATGTTTPVIDIDAAYVGQASITTLGTIASGVWQGTVVGSTYGGTGVNNAGRTLTISSNSAIISFASGKTLTVSNTLTLAGTDSTVMTFPSTSATIARTDAANTFTGLQTFSNAVNYTNNAIAASSNAATVPITARLNTVTNSSAATLTITMTTASAVDGQLTEVRVLDFSAVAQTITWVNTEDSTATAPTTSNGSTTLPKSVLFQFNGSTSKWRCIASA